MGMFDSVGEKERRPFACDGHTPTPRLKIIASDTSQVNGMSPLADSEDQL